MTAHPPASRDSAARPTQPIPYVGAGNPLGFEVVCSHPEEARRTTVKVVEQVAEVCSACDAALSGPADPTEDE